MKVIPTLVSWASWGKNKNNQEKIERHIEKLLILSDNSKNNWDAWMNAQTTVLNKLNNFERKLLIAVDETKNGEVYFQVCYVCTSKSGTLSPICNVGSYYHGFYHESSEN